MRNIIGPKIVEPVAAWYEATTDTEADTHAEPVAAVGPDESAPAEAGQAAAAGTYLIMLESGGQVESRKVVLQR